MILWQRQFQYTLGDGKAEDILDTDGLSLVSLLDGGAITPRLIAGEFLAEGVFDPTFMLRDDRFKLFYSESDPPLLFDLDADPVELSNLAGEPAYQTKLDELTKAAAQLWNAREIKTAIIDDQNRRRLVQRAHSVGRAPTWDFQPMTDASSQWVRAGKWTTEVEGEAHLPLADSQEN